MEMCSIPDCSGTVIARGLCRSHWYRWRRHGTPETNVRPPTISHEAWFWRKVRKTSGCWEWQGRTDKDGYGIMKVGPHNARMHRFSWELHNGPIPDGLWVLHHCDNPPCVRIDHLWLGTATDNDADRHAKGRSRGGSTNRARGSHNGSSKLTEAEVLEIRRRWASGETQTAISLSVGIAQTNISQIVLRKRWTHI